MRLDPAVLAGLEWSFASITVVGANRFGWKEYLKKSALFVVGKQACLGSGNTRKNASDECTRCIHLLGRELVIRMFIFLVFPNEPPDGERFVAGPDTGVALAAVDGIEWAARILPG